MKAIVTGATGFIGAEVLHQCLQNPAITSVVVLTRRDLPQSTPRNPKLTVLIHEDFEAYPQSTLEQLSDAHACIWCLGRPKFPDNETAKKVSVDYPLAAAKAFAEATQTSLGDAKFRFLFVSGMFVEKDQNKKLWILQDFRRIKGQAENELLALAQGQDSRVAAFVIRPGGVLAKGNSISGMLFSGSYCVKVDELAAAMIGIAVSGGDEKILENKDLRNRGKKALEGVKR